MTLPPKDGETLVDEIITLIDGQPIPRIGNVLAHVVAAIALTCERPDIISTVAEVALELYIENSKNNPNH